MIDVLKRFPRNRRPISSVLTFGRRVPSRYRRPDSKCTPVQAIIDIGHWGIPHCALCLSDIDNQPVVSFDGGEEDWYCLGCTGRLVQRENLRFLSSMLEDLRREMSE